LLGVPGMTGEEGKDFLAGYGFGFPIAEFLAEFVQYETIISNGAFFLNLSYGSLENNR
jgi:hypothetical protein